MEHQITPEVAMAIQKGEHDCAYLLCEFERVTTPDNIQVRNNAKWAMQHIEREIRGTL